jgi:hypothetical protein
MTKLIIDFRNFLKAHKNEEGVCIRDALVAEAPQTHMLWLLQRSGLGAARGGSDACGISCRL